MALHNTSLSVTDADRLTHYFRLLEHQTLYSNPSLSVTNVRRLVHYFLKARDSSRPVSSVTHAALNSNCGLNVVLFRFLPRPRPQPSSVPVSSPTPVVLNLTMLSPNLPVLDGALPCRPHLAGFWPGIFFLPTLDLLLKSSCRQIIFSFPISIQPSHSAIARRRLRVEVELVFPSLQLLASPRFRCLDSRTNSEDFSFLEFENRRPLSLQIIDLVAFCDRLIAAETRLQPSRVSHHG